MQITGWYLKGINFEDAPASLKELENCGTRVDLKKADLAGAAKWEPLLQGMQETALPGWVPLAQLASFRRGIATGANGYFLLSRERIEALGIDIDRCYKCVGRASDVKGLVYSIAEFEAAAAQGGKLFLLNLSDPLTLAEKQYVLEGEAQSLNTRFLLANRRPWYSMEQRRVAGIWAAVFGRGDLRFVFNEAGVRSLTNFHCIYPNSSDMHFQRALTFCLNTSKVREASKMHGRVYGGGLNKFEPNDLKSIQVPDLRQIPHELLVKMSDLLTSLDDSSDGTLAGIADDLCSQAGEAAATV